MEEEIVHRNPFPDLLFTMVGRIRYHVRYIGLGNHIVLIGASLLVFVSLRCELYWWEIYPTDLILLYFLFRSLAAGH